MDGATFDALAAGRSKQTYLSTQYHRLAARRGTKRAAGRLLPAAEAGKRRR